MTQEEVYREYLRWSKGLPRISRKDLFRLSFANYDVYENADIVVNHLYYLFIKCAGEKADGFFFYEENTFIKEADGDLVLMCSTYYVQQSKSPAH